MAQQEEVMTRAFAFAAGLAAGLSALAPSIAHAEIISLSAMGFAHHAVSTSTQDPNPNNGTLSPVVGINLYHNVDFPVNGRRICKMTLVFGDTNGAENIVARLFRKRITIGGSVFQQPQAIATVSSAGSTDGLRKAMRAVQTSLQVIDEVNWFYYVEVTAPNFNTPLVGVQIEHKVACP
jgi:hypothetical protein